MTYHSYTIEYHDLNFQNVHAALLQFVMIFTITVVDWNADESTMSLISPYALTTLTLSQSSIINLMIKRLVRKQMQTRYSYFS